MLKKFLKEVVIILAGKQAEEIVELLSTKKYVNEFLIAKKLGITINQTRNILYKISDQGLVSSIRKKDKKKGWYTYYWKIEILKSLEFLKEVLIKKMNQIEYQIKSRETKQFYVCERCNIEFSEENALLHDFVCNECGDVFKIKDNTKLIKELKRNFDKLKKELEFVNQEIEKERQKIEKSKLKKVKKQKIEKSIKTKKPLKKEVKLKKKSKKSVYVKKRPKKSLGKKKKKEISVKKSKRKKSGKKFTKKKPKKKIKKKTIRGIIKKIKAKRKSKKK